MEAQDFPKLEYIWGRQYRNKVIAYQSSEMEIINEAFINGRKTVTLRKSTCINFDKMTQKKVGSGVFLNLICGIVSGRECFTWLWQDEESFNCYVPALILRLELAYYLKHKTVKFYFHDDYEVDLRAMKQINVNSGKLRKVKRVEMFDSLAKVPLNLSQECYLQFRKIFLTSMALNPDVIHFVVPHVPPLKMERKKRKDHEDENQPPSATNKLAIVPVDPECAEKHNYHVYREGGTVYHATLNQTNLQYNNNKFFILQLLQHDKKKIFAVFFRWGRVGAKGQNNLVTKPGENLAEAKAIFEKKFYDKTDNEWLDTVNGIFEKRDGKYDFLRTDLSPEADKVNVQTVASKLGERIQSLLQLICDKKIMEKIMLDMSYDSSKQPLGKLTVKQISDGYAALNGIASAINGRKKGSELVRACNLFYTKIPHNFGMRPPPILRTANDVAVKRDMLETLENIRVALELMGEKTVEIMNPLDKYYSSLHCDLDVLDHSSEEFKVLENILESTHGTTHNYKLRILDAFRCHKESEHKNFKDCGKSLLLWHGSRLSNWLGILRNGLLIAPPEAPVTGYMFGKGIYFADACTKSANYCNMNKMDREGLLLLCEVSLGKSLQVVRSEELLGKSQRLFNSVQGLGRYKPSFHQKTILSSEAEAVFGPLVEDTSGEEFELVYNEYVVYDVRQVKLRYLLRITATEK